MTSPIVFIPGWGLGIGSLNTLAKEFGGVVLPLPGYANNGQNTPAIFDFEAACQWIAEQLACHTTLCGWSLGSLLAQRVATLAPEKIGKLALIAATPSFIQRPNWPDATPPSVLIEFMSAMAENPSQTLRQFVRGFNRGDSHSKLASQYLLSTMSPLPPTETLLAGLTWLRDVDLRQQAKDISAPTLLLHGEKDPLMPLAGAKTFAAHLPNAQLTVFAGCAHAPFVSAPKDFHTKLSTFLTATLGDKA